MVFWLAVLVGGLFAWIAVKFGFYATWIMFFNLLVSIYAAIMLTPVLIANVPATTTLPGGYGYVLTLMSVAVATLFITYGICYACLSGRLRVDFPKVFDNVVAGSLGFLTGFLVLSFVSFAFCLTPLSQIDVCKKFGFVAPSQRTNTAYVCWWCDRVHGMVSPLGSEVTGAKAVGILLEKAFPPAPKEVKPAAPAPSAQPPAPPAPTPTVPIQPSAAPAPDKPTT